MLIELSCLTPVHHILTSLTDSAERTSYVSNERGTSDQHNTDTSKSNKTDSLRPWQVLSQTPLLDAQPWLVVYSETVQLPTGHAVENYQTVNMPAYVVIVGFTDEGRVIVERNYKHGPRRVCLNLPAGYIASSEEPLAAAKRELAEETGYEASDWLPLGSFVNDGNRGAGVGHLFLARHAQQVSEPNSGDLEEIEIHLLSPDDLTEAIRAGDMPVLSSAAAFALAVLTNPSAP
jgi:ADP-ribose pyrophosphatase